MKAAKINRKSQSSYNHVFAPEKWSLRLKDDLFRQISWQNTRIWLGPTRDEI